MGLTIEYTLSTRRRLSLAGVKKLIAPLHARAVALGFENVSKPFEVGPDYPAAFHWPPGAKKFADLLPPSEGWVFHATPGDGSESAQIGLCRYAGVPGWRLQSFCKTQYAARQGWENFLKCHRVVTELLWTAKHAGLCVEVHDEGGLWESGSHAVLRRNLEEYDRCIAAFGGALKDAAGAAGNAVDGPIFNHPHFEHLEAEGTLAHGRKIANAVHAVKRFARDSSS